jgi:septal ring factor EnvC (AmiA/AmiB activator)
MAEDFYRLFGTGVHEIIETDSTGQLVRRPNPDVDKYLAASDVAGVALLGIQALHEENAQLRQRVADLEREDAQLRQQVSDLKTENVQLRQQTSDIRTENAALRARLERLGTLVHKIASTQTNPY